MPGAVGEILSAIDLAQYNYNQQNVKPYEMGDA
jgi:hypothetical protein